MKGHPIGLRRAVATALWFTLVGSLVEIAILCVERRAHPMMSLSRDFFWMAPMGLLLAALGAMVPGVLVASVSQSRVGAALILFGPSWLVLLDLLMLIPGLSPIASAVLAAGAAVRATHVTLRHPDESSRLVQRSALVLASSFVVVGAGMWLWTRQVSGSSTAPAFPAELAQPGTPPLNVLLITLDTVRAANLDLYGYARRTSPNLARFAARGVVFDNAFSTAPWTLPSHASLFTGRWPHELSVDYESPLDDIHPTLAEYLSARGYATAGFVGNLGYCGYGTGLGRGFGHYEDYEPSLGQIASTSTLLRNVGDNFRLRRLIRNDQHLNRIDAADLNARVLSWLSKHAETPSFVFVNYFDAHEPYLPPPPFDRQFGAGRGRGKYSPLHHWLWDLSMEHRPLSPDEQQEEVDAYDGAIAYLDERVGQLLTELDRRGSLQNTLVVITADHGEELGEHGLYDHGYSLYRPSLQVPLIVVAPGQVPAARRVSVPVSLRDIPATIVDRLGASAGAPFPGRSLASRWNDSQGTPAPQDVLLSEVRRARGQPEWFPASKGDLTSVFFESTHCIRSGDGSEELYDLHGDPWERHNLASWAEYQPQLTACRLMIDRLLAR